MKTVLNRHSCGWVFVLLILTMSSRIPVSADWDIEVVDSWDNVGEYCSIALNSMDVPHIAYYSATERVPYFASPSEHGWAPRRVTNIAGQGKYTSLDFDSLDQPGISYYDETNKILKFAHKTDSIWHVSTVDDDEQVGKYSSLTFDIADRPHIAYQRQELNHLRYAYLYAGTWQITDIDRSGYQTDLVLSPSGGFPHICHMWPITGEHAHLYYTSNIGAGWSTVEVATDGTQGYGCRIALDAYSKPMIAHLNSNENRLVLHSVNHLDEWISETVETNPYLGYKLDLAADQYGWPHISYHDSELGSLKYAYWSGTEWVIETVDNDGTQGYYSSIAIDSQGVAHIAYYDSGRNDLRYAHWVPDPGPPWYDLVMMDIDLRPGENFQLRAQGGNTTDTPLWVDEYILLEVYGQFWFYPGWTQTPDFNARTINPEDEFDNIILNFVWPPDAGAASGLFFHGGLVRHGTVELIDLDSVEWGYSS